MTDDTQIADTTAQAPQDTLEQTFFDRMVMRGGEFFAGFYLIAVFITVYEVFMRYVFHAPTQWVFEVSIMLVGSAMLYGGSYCLANDSHIRVTVVTDALPIGVRRWIDMIVAFLTFLFMLSLCYAAYIMAHKAFYTPSGEFRLETSGSAYNSPMPAEIKLMLVIVVFLMAFQTFVQFIDKCRLIGKGAQS